MIDNVHQARIKCMFETIDRTKSGTSNKFWQRIKQSNGTPPETIISKCARTTIVYMRDNTISSSRSAWVYTMGFEKFGTKSSIIFSGILIPIVVLGRH